MLLLRYIERHYQGFPVDFLPLLCLNIFHSYTPFFDLNFSNLLLHSIQERVSLFYQKLKYFLHYSKLNKGGSGGCLVCHDTNFEIPIHYIMLGFKRQNPTTFVNKSRDARFCVSTTTLKFLNVKYEEG